MLFSSQSLHNHYIHKWLDSFFSRCHFYKVISTYMLYFWQWHIKMPLKLNTKSVIIVLCRKKTGRVLYLQKVFFLLYCNARTATIECCSKLIFIVYQLDERGAYSGTICITKKKNTYMMQQQHKKKCLSLPITWFYWKINLLFLVLLSLILLLFFHFCIRVPPCGQGRLKWTFSLKSILCKKQPF